MKYYAVKYLKNNILSPGTYHFCSQEQYEPKDIVELEPHGCGVVIEEVTQEAVESIGLNRIRRIKGKVET